MHNFVLKTVKVVTPTDRPKSVRDRCVIEVICGVFVLSIGFRFSVGIRGFVRRDDNCDIAPASLSLSSSLLLLSSVDKNFNLGHNL